MVLGRTTISPRYIGVLIFSFICISLGGEMPEFPIFMYVPYLHLEINTINMHAD